MTYNAQSPAIPVSAQTMARVREADRPAEPCQSTCEFVPLPRE